MSHDHWHGGAILRKSTLTPFLVARRPPTSFTSVTMTIEPKEIRKLTKPMFGLSSDKSTNPHREGSDANGDHHLWRDANSGGNAHHCRQFANSESRRQRF